jgi:hypothetical protein
VIGRYDARVSAPVGSDLALDGDPSSSLISASFEVAITGYLRDTLRYRNASPYVMFSRAIESWDFRHGGKDLPDTIPDLGAALALNPQLRVLAINGYHDLATPFYQTELDLARLNLPSRVLVRNYAGGHMTYLDDAARVASKLDLQAFYRGTLSGAQSPMQSATQAPALRAQAMATPGASTLRHDFDSEAWRSPLRDPWVPQSLRPLVAPPPSSQGQVLQREIDIRALELRQRGASF